MPPLLERANFAARQDHQVAQVVRGRPDVLAFDAVSVPREA